VTTRHTLGSACAQIVDCEHRTTPIDPSGEYFAVGTPAMNGNVINYKEARRISKETFKSWTRRLLPRVGDLLLAREAPVGPIVRIPAAENVAPGQRTVLLRPDPNIVDSDYLYYLLSSPQQQDLLTAKGAGSTVAHLNVADVRSFGLPDLPPVDEQRPIAEVLGVLDEKIAVNVKLAGAALALARALFSRALDGGNGERVILGKIARHLPGKYLSKDAYATGGQYSVYGSNSLMGGHDEALYQGAFAVLARIGSYCGSLRWSQRAAWVNNNASALVARQGTDPWILRHVLDRVDMAPHRAGSGQPFIRIDSLLSVDVKVPSDLRCGLIAPILKNLAERETLATEESRTLVATRDALLPQLMSGKIRVKDAEKAAEEVL
jgi:type I restriction enzyme, S subunit